MEHIKHEDAIQYVKPYCTVYEYPTKNPEINIGLAEITHRYPPQGYAINHKCTEMGYILKGTGKLVTETRQALLSPGDIVLIPAGEKYYWEGALTILLPCTPAWTPDQHETLEDTLEHHIP